MGSHVGPVDPDSERSLVEAVDGWQGKLSPARLDALSAELDCMADREKPLILALRKAIESDPRTLNAIAVDSGLSASVVWRFMGEQRSLSLEAMLALAETLGLELRWKRKTKRTTRKGTK
jgi:DNA-binding phage protein